MTVGAPVSVFASGVPPEVGTAFTVLPALVVILAYVGLRAEWDLGRAWPFLLAGMLAPGCSQILFTFAIRDAGPSRASVDRRDGPALRRDDRARLPRRAARRPGSLRVPSSSSRAASCSRANASRPEHVKRIGLVFALLATLAFGTRDTLVRWLGRATPTSTRARRAAPRCSRERRSILGFVALRRLPARIDGLPRFLPAGLLLGLSYVCSSRPSIAAASASSRLSSRPSRYGEWRSRCSVPAHGARGAAACVRSGPRRRRRSADRDLPIDDKDLIRSDSDLSPIDQTQGVLPRGRS